MWEQVEIAGRPADAFTPGPGPYPGAVLYLHGYAGESLQQSAEFTSLLEQERLPVICPQGGKSWWLPVTTPEFPDQSPLDYLRNEVTPWAQARWGLSSRQLALLGVSMGGQGALQLAYRHALEYPVVVAISPAIDFDRIYGRGYSVEEIFPDAEAARQETVTLHLHPLNWPKSQFFCSDPLDQNWHEGCDRLASKLSSSGVPFECELGASQGGHGWEYFNFMAPRAVDFIVRGLRRI